MGLLATIAAWEATDEKGAGLILMLALADNADDDGVCFPASTADLMHKGRLSRRGVQLALDNMEKRLKIKLLKKPIYDPVRRKTIPGVYQIVEAPVIAYLAELKARRVESRQTRGAHDVRRGGAPGAPGGRTTYAGGAHDVRRGGAPGAPALLIDPPVSFGRSHREETPPTKSPRETPRETPSKTGLIPATVAEVKRWVLVIEECQKDAKLRSWIGRTACQSRGKKDGLFRIHAENAFVAEWLSENADLVLKASKTARTWAKGKGFLFVSAAEDAPGKVLKLLPEYSTALRAVEQLVLWHQTGGHDRLPDRTISAVNSVGGFKRFRFAVEDQPQELGFWVREFSRAYHEPAEEHESVMMQNRKGAK